jgi:hypothetical protein
MAKKQKDILAHLPSSKKLRELHECFYGPVVDRDIKEDIGRKRHGLNGWRNGRSNPFEYEGKLYDVQETIDASVRLFKSLDMRVRTTLVTKEKE